MSPQEGPQRLRIPALSAALVGRALLLTAELRGVSADLTSAGLPGVLVGGMPLKARLHPHAIPPSDTEAIVFVQKAHRGRAKEILRQRNWWALRFLDGGICYWKDGMSLFLIWRLHKSLLVSFSLKPLEDALLRRGAGGAAGLFEPDAECLFTLLSVAPSLRAELRDEGWSSDVRASRVLVRDWRKVWELARRAHAERAVEGSLGDHIGEPPDAAIGGFLGRFRGVGGQLFDRLMSEKSRRAVERLSNVIAQERMSFEHERRLFSYRFCGLNLHVGPLVYRPQKSSERLVDMTSRLVQDVVAPVIVDVGTGSGAVALALAVRRPDAQIFASDVSRAALRYARHNARRIGARNVTFHRGSLLEPVPLPRGAAVTVVANLPYIPSNNAGQYDHIAPRVAVDGRSEDGLGLLSQLAEHGKSALERNGILVIQIADALVAQLQGRLSALGYVRVQRKIGRYHTGVVAALSDDALGRARLDHLGR